MAALVAALPVVMVLGMWAWMIRMPGCSHHGALPALTDGERAYAAQLKRDIEVLASDIGERNLTKPEALQRAADHVAKRMGDGGYEVTRLPLSADSERIFNLEVELKGHGRDKEIVVVGAHYDAAVGAPGANDNGSGTAALLALAQAFAGKPQSRTIRFVAFVNEEPPYFQTAKMGSLRYAARCHSQGDRIVAMLSLETMGYFADEPGSQRYPFPLSTFYPDAGNFIAVVGDLSSRALVHQVIASMRSHTQFPSEGAALPSGVPGVGWSDHWAFWQHGYPAVMITDTAPFRYPHYHTAEDTPDKVDLERLARVVAGLERVIGDLAGAE